MKLDYKDTCLVVSEEINKLSKNILGYIDHLVKVSNAKNYYFPESSINLPFDRELLKEVENLSKIKNSSKLKYVIVIGIGGSNLGTKAIYDAIYSHFDVLETDRSPKIIFADTIDPEFMQKLINLLSQKINDPEEILIIPISKSGTTLETVVNLEVIYNTVKERFPFINERVIAITDFKSKLWEKAEEKNISTICIPENIGGRYSVFSAVGLVPLSLVGVDIQSLLEGARHMRDLCLDKDVSKNPALVSAIISYSQFTKGRYINNNFFFKPEFDSVGKWYRQLMGESIGKEKDRNGKIVNTGITPIVSIGSTDLHSIAQLYLGGPKDKTTTFVSTQKDLDVTVPQDLSWQGLADIIKGKFLNEVLHAVLSGTQIAYKNRGLSFVNVVLEDSSEKSLGEFLQFKMIEMMYLGRLMNVNPFDQPNVEDYKVETKKILSGKV